MRVLERLRGRRRIGRAYEVAVEVAAYVPEAQSVLDLGCGDGFVAYHLGALLGAAVRGVDLTETTAAPIRYERFDGRRLSHGDATFDAVLLNFVLHHATDPAGLLCEARRVLSQDGRMLVYEDIPERWHDVLSCLVHDLKWRRRVGPCSFSHVPVWRGLFEALSLRVIEERSLPRLRDPSHPVRRRLFVLEHAARR